MGDCLPCKIHIIGSVGSGKTTLAKALSTNLMIPFYELDNVVWNRTELGDIRRSEQERDEYLKKIVDSQKWIIEGVHFGWVSNSFLNADLIVLLDTKYSKRVYRIIKRFIFQKIGIEKSNYKPTFKIFRKMFSWNALYENETKTEILNELSEFKEKLIILEDSNDLSKILGNQSLNRLQTSNGWKNEKYYV